ncbi:hypothetical protein [Aeromonas caviae]|uniref:hypothetical protein n=1 Tax=Aeromonas caviae TaxID=648 RepID=UPI002DD685EE|nr:hypothetical protein [Aeromonas caviae]
MLDDKLCWALDEGFLQKMAVLIRLPDKALIRRVGEEGLSVLCQQALFHHAATPCVLLEQVIFASVKQAGFKGFPYWNNPYTKMAVPNKKETLSCSAHGEGGR